MGSKPVLVYFRHTVEKSQCSLPVTLVGKHMNLILGCILSFNASKSPKRVTFNGKCTFSMACNSTRTFVNIVLAQADTITRFVTAYLAGLMGKVPT